MRKLSIQKLMEFPKAAFVRSKIGGIYIYVYAPLSPTKAQYEAILSTLVSGATN